MSGWDDLERSQALRVLLAVSFVALSGGGFAALASHKTITLAVDGTTTTVTTMRSRVAAIVAENGLTVGDRDEVSPAADDTVADSGTIVLRRSRPLQVTLDGRRPEEVWTTAVTVDQALAQLKMGEVAAVAVDPATHVPLAGMALPVVSAKTVQINDGGVVSTVHLAAPNVGALLAAADLPLQQGDTVVDTAAFGRVEEGEVGDVADRHVA